MRRSLPKDPHLRAVWLERIGLSESAAPISARVCGRHFPPEAYLYNLEFVRTSAVGIKHLHLKKNTVPTLLLPKTRAQVLVMQVPGASASAAAIGPAQVFQEHESTLLAGNEVELARDGRCDSRGFSATYMTYSVLARGVGRIILSEQMQGWRALCPLVSPWKKEGLKRCLEKLDASGVMVQSLTTANSSWNSRKHGLTELLCIHIPGVKKKLRAASKRHAVLECWIQPIANHLYWVAAMAQGDSELILSMWKSILNNVCDVHTGHDGPFAECLHEPLEDRQWIKPSLFCCLLSSVQGFCCPERHRGEPILLRDLTQIAPAAQTFSLESFHSVLIHFALKSNAFTQGVRKARTRLAVLHFNENAAREQAKTQDGINRYKIKSSKSRKGHYTACPVKEDRSYRYVAELMMNAVQRCETQSYRTSRESTKSLDSEQEAGNCNRPPSKDEARERKAQLVQSGRSRYPASSVG
ncbi:hypothetical protein HPB48_019215 [Haemaphysalis longicornis]|uniref:THAP-type domain-containing protein n=1 Tax=Haemaphysalis longicornis TaxID=44386 RepID=A0A9J6GCT4_HAELO|nr:hypothetical protein HPB48_019215 [Haemaphysalis longicornis]